MKFVIIYVIVGFVVEKGTSSQVCKANEVYQDCSNGPACQTTCENYNDPPICIQSCSTEFAGCYCRAPYIRSDLGECVPYNQCKQKVVEPQQPFCKGPNEVYNPKGTVCPRTCATKDIRFKCSSDTQPGCFCAPGYLRNSKNRCVLECECS